MLEDNQAVLEVGHSTGLEVEETAIWSAEVAAVHLATAVW